jgi:hypothetical protein
MFAILAANAFQLACGETRNGPAGGAGSASISMRGNSAAGASGASAAGGSALDGSGGTDPSSGGSSAMGEADAGVSEPDATIAEQARHLGKPFTIVNGFISAASNAYGLEGTLFVIHGSVGTTVNTTSLADELCFNGSNARNTDGDYSNRWGFVAGFDSAAPWDLDSGRVLGISARVTGATFPRHLGFAADSTSLTRADYGNCDFTQVTSSGQVVGELFANLHSQCWDLSLRPGSAWQNEPVVSFGWGVGSDEIAANPFDFCLSEIRPILAGAGPDEAADAVPDAGSTAGAPDGGG